jgi:hypothetical protein
MQLLQARRWQLLLQLPGLQQACSCIGNVHAVEFRFKTMSEIV